MNEYAQRLTKQMPYYLTRKNVMCGRLHFYFWVNYTQSCS